jgi:hypothetical protein
VKGQPVKRIPRFSISRILNYLRDEQRDNDGDIHFHVITVDRWLESLPEDAPEEPEIGMNVIPFAPR